MVNIDETIIARLESYGEKFEILVDPDLAADFRNPDNEKEINIEDILAVEEIFKDSKKGDKASDESMKKVFDTTDVLEVAEQILKKGNIQITADQRRQMQEDKRKQVISTIAREGINPQNGLPHPMNEAKVKIDPFKSVDEQVQIALKAIKILIPIKFEKVRVAVRLPNTATGQAYSAIRPFGKIITEEWQDDGSWIAIVEMSGGLQDDFNHKMASISGGEAETKVIK